MAIQNTMQSAADLTIKSAEAVNQINQMIIDKNNEISKKMINVNAELKLMDLRSEGIARQIDVLA